MKIQLSKATTHNDYIQIAEIAKIVWHRTYNSIISTDQIQYMLDKFQSAVAIADQIQDGYEYFCINHDNKIVGYIAFVGQADRLFMSKLYILPQAQGLGCARAAFDYMRNHAQNNGINTIYLTVNKHNHNAIAAYKRLGFIQADSIMQDIGNGYIMDDYIMEYYL